MDDKDVEKFDERAHRLKMGTMQARYLLAAIVVASTLMAWKCEPDSEPTRQHENIDYWHGNAKGCEEAHD